MSSEASSDELSEAHPIDLTGDAAVPGRSGEAPEFAFALWSDTLNEWWFGDLDTWNSSYRDGEAVPAMLRIEKATPGATYAITIRYDCAQGDGPGYDFLTRFDRDRGVAPALHGYGPGISIPDAILAMAGNEGLTFDERERDRFFKVWGGSFLSEAEGPEPEGPCLSDPRGDAEKTYTLSVRAVSQRVILLWGGHLASNSDWGEGRGAASAQGSANQRIVTAVVSDEGRWQRQSAIRIAAILPPYGAPSASPSIPP